MNAGIKAINATITNAMMNGNAQIKRNITMKNRIIIRNVVMFVLLYFFILVIVFACIIYIKLKVRFEVFLRKNTKKVKKVNPRCIQLLNKHKKTVE